MRASRHAVSWYAAFPTQSSFLTVVRAIPLPTSRADGITECSTAFSYGLRSQRIPFQGTLVMLRLKGSQHLRQRLVLATVSGKAIRIDDIRAKDLNPGLRDFEASFLRLLEKLTDGCLVEINETGGIYFLHKFLTQFCHCRSSCLQKSGLEWNADFTFRFCRSSPISCLT